ncbi:MAG TPA: hypothetical protein VEL81_03230 [Thermoplasmata archaeon]|nr:hypothetical protein [Thermoplasmata archaeon]
MAAPLPTQLPEPLRLPRGSVRGGIAVLVTATYGYLLILGPTVPTVVVNAVVVVVAFYFGSHATATPPRAPSAPPPPHRPRLVRALLLLGFLGLAGWFLWQYRTLSGIPSALVAVLEVLGGYVGGYAVSWLVHRRAHTSPLRKRLATFFRDATAIGALGLTGYICYAFATNQGSAFAGHAEDALSLVVTFYFGSRVIGH